MRRCLDRVAAFLLVVLTLGPLCRGQEPLEVIQRAKRSVFQVRVSMANGTAASGTGFLIGPNGMAITNFHVVQGASGAVADFPGSDKDVPVTLVAVNPGMDLALLQIPVDRPTLRGAIEPLRIRGGAAPEGLEVWALGFPRLGFTVTRGIVSGVRRYEEGAIRLEVRPHLKLGADRLHDQRGPQRRAAH